MIYRDIPVFRHGLVSGEVIGRATVEVHEDDGTSTVTLHTTTSEFNDFLKKGTLKGIELNAQVVQPFSKEK